MNRDFRNLLFFVVGVLLSAVSVFAMAEEIPATKTATGKWNVNQYDYNTFYDSPGAACAAWGDAPPVCENRNITFPGECAYWRCGAPSWKGVQTHITGESYSCPANGNWTLQGDKCVRPDCAPGQTRNPDGTCDAPCEAGQTSSASRYVGLFVGSGGTTYGGQTPTPSSLCDGRCVGTVDSVDSCPKNNLTPGTPIQCDYTIILTGEQCTGGNGTAPVDPTTNKPNPPCSPGDGVMSNQEGKVVCVEGGTNGSTTPPKVNKSQSTKTFDDGSQQITTTTQTCTGDGACSTTTTVTNTTATGGGAGKAGTPGTTTSTNDKPSSEQSEFCAKNPTSPLCKGDGLATEATQKEILTEIQKISEAKELDEAALTSKGGSVMGGEQQRLEFEKQTEKIQDYVTGETPASSQEQSSKNTWAAAMAESSWWSDIPRGGCSAFDVRVGKWTWHFDHCAKAAQISEIAGYCLWIGLLINAIMLLTGGRG